MCSWSSPCAWRSLSRNKQQNLPKNGKEISIGNQSRWQMQGPELHIIRGAGYPRCRKWPESWRLIVSRGWLLNLSYGNHSLIRGLSHGRTWFAQLPSSESDYYLHLQNSSFLCTGRICQGSQGCIFTLWTVIWADRTVVVLSGRKRGPARKGSQCYGE